MKYEPGDVYLEDGIFQLPHQCSEWKIGSDRDARRFIADVEALLSGHGHRCRGTWGSGTRGTPCVRIALAGMCPEHRDQT